MSVITLLYGQCGNQIGQSLFQYLHEDINTPLNKNSKQLKKDDYYRESQNKWFRLNANNKLEAKALLIDAENKVVFRTSKSENFTFKNTISGAYGGSGNNWALGYFNKSDLLIGETMETIRKEMEKSDFVSCFLNIFSSGGGTGSGVGAKVIRRLRDNYSNKIISNVVILPYSTGEIVTQSYNTLLSLSKIYNKSDVTFLFENDHFLQVCKKLLEISNVTYDDINALIATQLSSIFQPVSNLTIPDIVSNLSCHPSYKFIQSKTVPVFKKETLGFDAPISWSSLLRNVQIKNCTLNKNLKFSPPKLKAFGNILITRGITKPNEQEVENVKNSFKYVSWLPEDAKFKHFHQNRNFNSSPKCATLLSNNNQCSTFLNSTLEDAWSLFTCGVYLHHYKKFGVDEQFFLESFQNLETVFQDYSSL